MLADAQLLADLGHGQGGDHLHKPLVGGPADLFPLLHFRYLSDGGVDIFRSQSPKSGNFFGIFDDLAVMPVDHFQRSPAVAGHEAAALPFL